MKMDSLPIVNRLDNASSLYIHACSLLPSLSRVLQELVQNSIDAAANIIYVQVDAINYHVEVVDDGNGFSFNSLYFDVGEWSATTRKDHANSRSRGQKLAALSVLSKLEIKSKTSLAKYTYIKNFSSGDVLRTQNENDKSGTSVKVCDLFYNIPVRRKSLRPNLELLKIKEFLQKMAMLNHNIQFTLIDSSVNRELWSVLSDVSVAARFSKIHNHTLLNKLKEVSAASGNYIISGLLSAPREICCHWSKECQYAFINNRSWKGGDMLSSILNRTYLSLLGHSRAPGPAAKHFTPGSIQTVLYPCFVLQLACPTEEFDVVHDGDKIVVIFRRPSFVKSLIFELLRNLIEKYRPELTSQLNALIPDFSPEDDVMESRQLSSTVRDRQKMNSNVELSPDERNVIGHPSFTKFASWTADEVADKSKKRKVQEPNRVDGENVSEFDEEDIKSKSNGASTASLKQDHRMHRGLNADIDPYSVGYSPHPDLASSSRAAIRVGSSSESGLLDKKESPSKAFTSAFFSHSPPGSESETYLQERESGTHKHVDIDDRPPRITLAREFGVTLLRRQNEFEEFYDRQLGLESLVSAEKLSHDTSLQETDANLNIGLRHPNALNTSDIDFLPTGSCMKSPNLQDYIEFENSFRYQSPTRASGVGAELFIPTTAPGSPHVSGCSVTSGKRRKSRRGQVRGKSKSCPEYSRSASGDGWDGVGDNIHETKEFARTGGSRSCDVGLTWKRHLTMAYEVIDAADDIDCSNDSDLDFGTNVGDTGDLGWVSTVGVDAAGPSAGLASPVARNYSEDDLDFRRLSSSPTLSSILQKDVNTLEIKTTNTYELVNVDENGVKELILNTVVSLQPITLTKNMLLDCSVLDQCNNSYILCYLSSGLLLCVDQHAADERVQLERLQALYALASDSSRAETKCSVQNPILKYDADAELEATTTGAAYSTCDEKCTVTGDHLRVLEHHKQLLIDRGFLYTLSPNSSQYNSNNRELHLTQVPNVLGESLQIGDFMELLNNITKNPHSPSMAMKPPAIQRILNSRACHTAIRFGDCLSVQQCREVLSSLARTDLPFQCAHGRPSVVPLLDISRLRGQSCIKRMKTRKPNYIQFSSNLGQHA